MKSFRVIKYIGFYIRNFYSLFSLASREKTDPYFREDESSEASGKQRLNEYTAHD